MFPTQTIPANPTPFVISDICGQTFYSASDTIHIKSKCYFIIKRRYYQLDEKTQRFRGKHPAPQSRLKASRHLGAQRNWDPWGEVAGKLSCMWQQVQAQNTQLWLQWLHCLFITLVTFRYTHGYMSMYVTYIRVNKDKRRALVILLHTILFTSMNIMLWALSPVSTEFFINSLKGLVVKHFVGTE